jgi:autotransporter-associated beta strand protein
MRVLSTLSCAALLLAATIEVPAAQLIWDPLNNAGASAGSGNWDTNAANTVWYNGTTDVAWTQNSATSGLNGAIFNGPDAPAGTYLVTNDLSQLAVTNLTINNSGYVFSGTNAIYLGANDILSVAAGKSVTFNCNMGGANTSPYWVLGNGATMNVTSNLIASQQLRLAGGTGSAINLSGPASTPGIMFILAPVNVTAGSLIPSSSFYIGYTQTAPPPVSTSYTTGTFTVSGSSTVVTINGNILIIGRSGGTGTLNVNGGTMTVGNATANRNLAICYDATAGSSGTVNVSGGSLVVGSTSQLNNAIAFFDTQPSTAANTGTLSQTGGNVLAYGGVIFGVGGGTGVASLTQTGGAFYVGQNGITKGAAYTGPYSITLSGGTIGALANWSTVLPLTLTNGSETFQTADNGGSPNNITLNGPLSGPGGIYVTGNGVLTLNGTNTYTGATVVSNGTLAMATGVTGSSLGTLAEDGSSGSPVLAVNVANPGQSLSVTGLSFTNGSASFNFGFGALAPSTATAPMQVAGNVSFGNTLTVNITGTSIANGTYPLVKYTGTVSGTLPSALNVPGYVSSAYLTNLAASKTIALVVTASSYNPALYWAVGSGTWDTTTPNWKQFGSPVDYHDGQAVIFDDSATGSSPITVTLNTTVNPLSVTANNVTNQYIITGSGSIGGTGGVALLNSGSLTLAVNNTYSGGTSVSGTSQLNINNGGSASGSAVGTGTLTLNAGATLDNTSGSNVTVQYPVPVTLNGNFTYAGSANLDLGPGGVTMTASVGANVASNALTIDGSISDNGGNDVLQKLGAGTLNLTAFNSISGGFTLSAGLVNIANSGALGGGSLITFAGGALDNISGGPLSLTPPHSYSWAGSFSYLGSADIDLGSPNVSIPNGLGNITLNVVSNTLLTQGDIQNNNTEVIKTGNGTWTIGGPGGGTQSLGLQINAGQVKFNKASGQAVTGGNNVGLTVLAGALAQDEADHQIHSDSAVAFPVYLNGGTWDLNGHSENLDKLFLTSGGTLQTTATGTALVDLISGYTASLTGTNCQFEVDQPNGVLNFQGPIGGTGSLCKTGLGTLNLLSNNVYSGNTIISNGTLALVGYSSLSNTAAIDLLSTNSALDLTQKTDAMSNATPTLNLLSGQTLSGFGVVTGMVVSVSGSTIAPGSATQVGTLTIAGSNTLGGVTSLKLDKGNHTNDQLVVTGSLVYGGTLQLTNLTGTLASGDSFTLFSAAGYSGAFSVINPFTPGPGLGWNTANLTVNGSISIVTASTPPSPRITMVGYSAGMLSLRGTNGPPNTQFILAATTNLTVPLANWTPVATNSFDASGNFNISVTPTNTPEYFGIQVQ